MLVPIANFISNIADRRSSTALFSLAIVMAFGALDFIVARLTMRNGINPDVHAALQATAIGLAAGLVAVLLLSARRERRNLVRNELQRVIELNHRLRNSLQIIADAHYFESEEAHRKMMFEAVESMHITLQQLFPSLGVERRKAPRAILTFPQTSK